MSFARQDDSPRPARLSRWLAGLYPRRAGLDAHELARFFDDALVDARRAGRVLPLAALARTTIADVLRAWLGLMARPLSAAPHPSPHLPAPRRTSTMDHLRLDLTHAWRSLARTPGLTAISILTLALGIGATTAAYGVARGVLLTPFPYLDVDRIVLLSELDAAGGPMSVSWLNYLDWRTQARSFEALGVYRNYTFTVAGVGDADRLFGAIASSSVFTTLGVQPLAGRAFGSADDEPGAASVLVSERFWMDRLGRRADVLGTPITIDGRAATIVGVMPASFQFPSHGDLWVPLGAVITQLPKARGNHAGLTAIGRLRSDASLETARADMETIARRLGDQYPDSNRNTHVSVTTYADSVLGDVRPAFRLLLGSVAVLLALTCINLAGVAIARTEQRQRELAVRTALGASRHALFRLMTVESSLLAAAGAIAGAGVAVASLRTLIAAQPESIPRLDLVAVNWTVLAVAAAVAVLAVFVFGALPAWRASQPSVARLVKALRSGDDRSAMWARRALVVAQVALASVLLVGAGLLGRSLTNLLCVDLGFDPSRVVTMRVALDDQRYPTPEAWTVFHQRLVDAMRHAPGIDAVGLNSLIPLEGGGSESGVLKDDDPLPPPPDARPRRTLFQATNADYFRAMRIPLVSGRLFDDRDTDRTQLVTVIDDTLAAALFPGTDPLGRRVAFEARGETLDTIVPIWREVIGVVKHVQHYDLHGGPDYGQLYTPYTQLPLWSRDRRPTMALFVRTAGSPDVMIATVRQLVRAIDPTIPVYGLRTATSYVDRRTEAARLSAALVGTFAGIALLLAALGLYGVLAYLVSRRTREIGVRIALGATPGGLVRRLVGQGLLIAGIGLALGLAASLAAGRWLSAMLVDVTPFDFTTYATSAVVLLAIGALASYLPARRAAEVDPIEALRSE